MPRKTKSNISQKSRRSRMQCQRRQKRKDAISQLQPDNNLETCIYLEPEPSKASELTDSTMSPHIKRSKVTTAARKMRLKREKEAQAPRDANPKRIKRKAQAPRDKNAKLMKREAQAPKDENPPLKLINPWLRGALGPSSAFRCELTARPFRYDPDADSSNSEAALSDAHKDDAEDDNGAEATDEAYINAYDAKPSRLNGSLIHSGFKCNVCHNDIIGYRYTCLQCLDWDMCSVCEAKGQHPEHYVLRLPAPKAEEESAAVLAAIRKHIDDLLNLKNEIHGIVIKHEVPEMGEDLDIDIKESNIDNKPKKILEFNVNPDSVTVNMVNSTTRHDNQLSKSSDAVTIRVRKEPNDGLSSTNETSTNYCEVSNYANSVNLSTANEMSRKYCEVSKYAKYVNRKQRRIEETSPNYCKVSNNAINVNTDCSIKTKTAVKLKKVVLNNTFLSSTSETSSKESQVSNNATNMNTDCLIKTEKVIKLEKEVLNNTFLSSMNETSPKELQVSNNAINVNTDWSTKTETSSKYCEDKNNVKHVNTDGLPKNKTLANHCEVSNSTNDVNTDLTSTNETSPDYCEVRFNTNSVNT